MIRKIILGITVLASFVVLLAFTTVSSQINQALEKGDYAQLSKLMNNTIELALFDSENVYSKVQAEQVLKQFFQENQPQKFKLLHNGQKENTQYFIGSLSTQTKTFRVYYLLKRKQQKALMYQLRIEIDE